MPQKKDAGFVALMRQLSADFCTPTSRFSAAENAMLEALCDTYGAVVSSSAGWRLSYSPEWLNGDYLQKFLSAPVVVADSLPSTNKAARNMPVPSFLFAEHQPAGLGQRNKSWLALPGDALIMSAVLPTPRHISGLSVAVGASLWESLAGDKRLCIKWPNDLLSLAGEKIGGILVEVIGKKTIIGVGINRRLTPVLVAHIAALGRPAAALNDILTLSRHACAIKVANAICWAVAGMAKVGFAKFYDLAMAAHIRDYGEFLLLQNGERERFAGFTDDGALLTQGKNGVRRHIQATVCG